MVTAVR